MTNYKILQIKDIENTNYAFRDYRRDEFNIEDYEVCYEGIFCEDEYSDFSICEVIFYLFNTRRPEDFCGRSLSVSDLIQLESDGKVRTYYCDRFNWTELRGVRA